MFGKKHPILTATTCSTMEMVRTALEVLIGKRVSYVCVDFNTCRGKIRIGDEEVGVAFDRSRTDLVNVLLGTEWYVAVFEEPTLVKVAKMFGTMPTRKTVAGDLPMRWAGRSATDRKEEPLFLKEAEYCAKVRGLTLEQLLNP